MSKKSQVTVFIIIGIAIVAMISAVGYIMLAGSSNDYVPASMSGIKLFIDQCLENTAEGAILLSGVQGGVIYFGEILPNQETFYSYSTYWYDKGLDTSVSREFTEQEISRYIEGEIDERCLKGLESFHENLEIGEISAETKIRPDYVEIEIKYPVTLIQGDTRTSISKFATIVPVKYGEAIDIANKIVAMEVDDPSFVRLSDISNMSLEVIPYNHIKDVVIYSIKDNENLVQDDEFRLVFANRFGEEKSGNTNPKILNAKNIISVFDQESKFSFRAYDSDGDDVEFSSTGRFKVDKRGTLKFTPTIDDIGEHSVTVTVTDAQGGRDAQTIRIKVIEA